MAVAFGSQIDIIWGWRTAFIGIGIAGVIAAFIMLLVVREPKREYLWILSRTPQMPAATYQALLSKLAKLGFDLQRVEASKP